MNSAYRCWAEIDLGALRDNLAWLRRRAGPQVRILTVVKADAYGHGLKQIAALLMQSGTDLFGVANLTEARAIRQVGKGWPILMLGACLPEEIETAVRDAVMPTISSMDEARLFASAAKRLHKPVDLHVKVDTGMGRLGATIRDAAALIRQIEQMEGLKLAGVYTHFALAEDDPGFTRLQRTRFGQVIRDLRRTGIHAPLFHSNNSAGVLCEPRSNLGLVRPGLLVYGILPKGRRRLPSEVAPWLRPALSWRCRVSLVKEISRGTPLSYGRTFIAPRKMKVATLTAGYGDGYLRAGSNRAEVLIGGRRCRVLGRITMDQMLADVSAVPHAKPGDEVVLIGRQGDGQISAQDVADWCDTVAWEVLTNISSRVPRVYRGAQAA
ncbi:MAG: alanine racemase [Verrucomicrobia bacterium]|nr:alanine racemase [Verrucomicrobiota bacterium]